MSIFKDKVLLITGGTGSFGNAVLRRFLDSDIKEIRIFSRDEKKQDDMRHFLQAQRPEVAHKVKFYIGNVRQREAVDFAMTGVDYVFSAAALKQVPSCEFFPMEAVRTNVEGTNNVLLSAIAHGVKNVVVLSTDKAAYPINAMGISKSMMEKVAIAQGRALGQNAKTTICCTRYGNVMASRGSVIPLWVEQMMDGKPITITDPNMTSIMYKKIFKRVIDFILVFCVLAMIWPILLLITVWLHFANKGAGAFFLQERPGKNGKIFKVIKFKTMTDERDTDGNLLPDADRLTKVGKFVRSTSIDELPQLINVLKGDMALIGPRPLLVQYLPLYNKEQVRRHEVRPGITGWAQCNGRNAISWTKKFELDVWYVDHCSLRVDLRILFITLKKVFVREGISQEGQATMEFFTGDN